MPKIELTSQEKEIKRILRQAGGAAALVASDLSYNDRDTLWRFWKTERHQGNYTCMVCKTLTYCQGERYDLMICRPCFLPEDPEPPTKVAPTTIIRKPVN